MTRLPSIASHLRGFAATSLLAGCAAAPLGLRPLPAQLHIANPERLVLRLDAVIGDDVVPCGELGGDAVVEIALWPGAYVLRAETAAGTIAVPAPLLAACLPADRRVHVRIASPPPEDPAFAFVPAGPAVIGDTLGIGQPEERPARLVDVPAFWLGRNEVTNSEYAAFLSAVEPDVDPAWCAFDSRKCRVARSGGRGGWCTDAPTLPIVTVSLAGAEAYCAWPPGRWFWRTIAQGPVVLGGVVDVRPGDGGKLALVGKTQHVPAADPAVAIQLDEVDGVSLRDLPASLRTVPVAGAGVTLPRRMVWSPAGR